MVGRPDAEAAIAEYEGRGPEPWAPAAPVAVSHSPLWHRGKSATRAAPGEDGQRRRTRIPTESGYRVGVEVKVLRNPEEDNGWTVRATTGRPEEGTDTEMLQADQDQTTTVEPGFRSDL